MTKDSLQKEIEDIEIAMSDISPALGMHRQLGERKKELEGKLDELKNE